MRIFVTGATGFVGSAVVEELLQSGHRVLGLARTDEGVEKLIRVGAEAHRGDLGDPETLSSGASISDGVIHTGFVHDFSRFQEVCEIDRKAIETLGATLAGSGRPLIVTSGMAAIRTGDLAVEDDPPAVGFPRRSEAAAAEWVDKGVRAMAVRLPPSVHGEGDHGFVPMLIGLAREKGAAAYVGEGLNRWAGVHRRDAARLYRLAIEKGTAGARYHGVGDEGVPFRELAEVIGKRLNLPVVSRTAEEAASHFGWMAAFASMDLGASSRRTQELLGWAPREIGLLEDVDQPYYF